MSTPKASAMKIKLKKLAQPFSPTNKKGSFTDYLQRDEM